MIDVVDKEPSTAEKEPVDAVQGGASDGAGEVPAEKKKPRKKITKMVEVYMLKGFFPHWGEDGEKLPAGTFQEVPEKYVSKLAGRQIIQDAAMARQAIEDGEPEAVLKRERGVFALTRKNVDRAEPTSDSWLDD